MKTITLYTGRAGMLLHKNNSPFIASVEKINDDDYIVTAPIDSVKKFETDDDFECYDVIYLEGVTVEMTKKEEI